jgi:hypothetical protein
VFSSLDLLGYFTSSYYDTFYFYGLSSAIMCTFKLLFVLFGSIAEIRDALLELESGEFTIIVGVLLKREVSVYAYLGITRLSVTLVGASIVILG